MVDTVHKISFWYTHSCAHCAHANKTNRKRLKVNVDFEWIGQPQGKLTAIFHNRHTMHAHTNEIGSFVLQTQFYFFVLLIVRVFSFLTTLQSIATAMARTSLENVEHTVFVNYVVIQFSNFNRKFSNKFIDGKMPSHCSSHLSVWSNQFSCLFCNRMYGIII